MASSDDAEVYSSSFFHSQRVTARSSASVLVPIILRLFEVRSVADVGCGVGEWLQELQSHGVTEVLGIDGDYVERSMLNIPESSFLAHDLGTSLDLDQRFDLVISLEVAEHITEELSGKFVDNIVSLGDVIVFSTAIPGQGGNRHINEQWPGYWEAHFASRGFVCRDVLRRAIWGDERVSWWYAQNTFVYIRQSALTAELDNTLKLFSLDQGNLDRALPIIHPGLFRDISGRSWRHVLLSSLAARTPWSMRRRLAPTAHRVLRMLGG